MRRISAHRVWIAYCGVEAFAFALGWTVAAVFFVRELDFSPLQLVLAGTALEVAYFVFEIPTGIVADTYGRKRSIIIGAAGLGLGFVATGLANGVWLVLLAAAFMGFAWTFKSGADEAWVTDEVGVENAGRSFQSGAQAARIGSLVGIGAAVGLALIDLRTPIVAGGAVLVVLALVLAVAMPETQFVSARAESLGTVAAMKGTAVDGGALIRRNPLLLLTIGIAFVLGASDEGFDRLWEAHFLEDVGVPGFAGLDFVVWFGVLAAGATLLAILVAQPLAGRLSRLGPAGMARTLLASAAVRIAALLAFALAGSFAVAVAAFWAARLVRSLAAPVYSTWLNANVEDSRVRATVLSMTNVFGSAGEWGGGPGIGLVGNVFGIRAALATSAVVLSPVLVLYGRAIRHHGREPELEALTTAPSSDGV
jgi:DHA3 family tetracycline resistance protein-like MFS transporter